VILLIRRFVTFTKMLVAAAGAFAALCTGAIACLQFGFWLIARRWSPVPVSRILELAQIEVQRRYFPASVDASQSNGLDAQALIEWVLDLPAILALFVSVALLGLVYLLLISVEKRLRGSATGY